MTQKYNAAGLDLPHIEAEDKLHRLLSSVCKHKTLVSSPHSFPSLYWDANYFNLPKVQIFQDATEEEQREILKLCSQALLEEAYFIEKAGVGYMAKMVLLAETIEERMLYALFSADEATHLAQITPFIPISKTVETNNPFLRLLADLVETQDKTVLLFVLQVVLEGWGLSHYRSLAQGCLHPDLAEIFTGFLQAESRHHATGVILFDRLSISAASEAAIAQTLALFLQMIQVGPQSVVAGIERVKGHLSRSQKVTIFAELDTETHSGTRLNLLRSLMRSAGAKTIVQQLEYRKAFQPFSPHNCVSPT
jgi:hypothetical protein